MLCRLHVYLCEIETTLFTFRLMFSLARYVHVYSACNTCVSVCYASCHWCAPALAGEEEQRWQPREPAAPGEEGGVEPQVGRGEGHAVCKGQ